MFLEVDGKVYDTSASVRLAFNRYRNQVRRQANASRDRFPDDVHTWDTLLRAGDGEIYLWRHENIRFGEEVLTTDQVLLLEVEDVKKWNEEVDPPYVTQEFLSLIGKA